MGSGSAYRTRGRLLERARRRVLSGSSRSSKMECACVEAARERDRRTGDDGPDTASRTDEDVR